MTTITRQQAEQLINSYCDDEPTIDAAELSQIDLPLVEQSTNDWIQIVNDLGMRQDDLDAILYK